MSLPHDLAGSRSKNRFRIELLWGVSKLLDLMEEPGDFTMVFDYVCDIEIHRENGFDFFQIKSKGNTSSFTANNLTSKKKEKGSILGKLYALSANAPKGSTKVAIVTNAPYYAFPTESPFNSFSALPEEEKDKLEAALKEELSVETIDFSDVFYIHVEKRIGTGAYSADLDALKKDIGLYQREYSEVLTKLNACKAKLIDLRNHLIDYESLLAEMQQFSQTNEKEIKKLNQHLCPECGSILSETIHLRSKRYNLAEDIVAIKNDIQASIVNVSRDIETEEGKYQQLLIELKQYETKVKMNTRQVNDVIRYKGLCEIRDGIVVEKSDLGDAIGLEEERISVLDKELRSYNAKKKKIEEEYYQLLSSARTRFGLFEIDSDKFKKLTNVFTASGSNKNIATIIWYLTIIELRKRYNSSAISFPVVFDSPNNVETDNTKKHSLLQYILENAGENQLVLSSIGFSAEEFPGIKNINVITLENSKYALLDAETYISNEALLNEFCDAVDSRQKVE